MDHARKILDELYALKRPDFQQTLAFWEKEIAKARINQENQMPQPPISVSMLTIDGPIWLPSSSGAASLFPSKDEDAVVVCFLGSTVESDETGEAGMQMADTNGRITRALTLFLCEQLHLRSDARGQAIQPWVIPGGFMLGGVEWESEFAIDQARNCQSPGDYIVVTHLAAKSHPSQIKFRLLRCIDGSLLDSGSFPLDASNLEPSFRQLANRLLSTLCQQAQVEPIHQPSVYQVPHGPNFNDYQLRIEQALAVRASGMDDTRPDFLSGQREIILGNVLLCLNEPQNVTTRVLLVETLARMKKVHPQVVAELRDKVQKLEREHPLAEPAQSVIETMMSEAIAP